MKLKYLEITGFKSFAKKNTLHFDRPVVGVVGPNGSGKSNVVEAIRFVLGEQSMKSLRGKAGSDLIFKGSKMLPKLGRASVSIAFDNKDRVFSSVGEGPESIALTFDEVILSREVYADGGNKYLINGTEVRLKDINEVLSRVHIGASGHHIISQGEADRLLSASSKDRRVMIEDALGLKMYQYRIKESERKLEKTRINMKEVSAQRREIVPHIQFLKKQVEKIEKAEEFRTELSSLYDEYLKREETEIARLTEALGQEEKVLTLQLEAIHSELNALPKNTDTPVDEIHQRERIELQEKEQALRKVKDELTRALGRLDGMIELENRKKEHTHAEEVRIPFSKVQLFTNEMITSIEEALSSDTLSDIHERLSVLKNHVHSFTSTYETHAPIEEENTILLDDIKKEQVLLKEKIDQITQEEQVLISARRTLDAKESAHREARYGSEHKKLELSIKKNEITNALSLLAVKREGLTKRKTDFTEEVQEGSVLVGQQIFSYRTFVVEGESIITQEERRKKIERIKIRLEDSGSAGGSDVINEYKEVTERDAFLMKELADLEDSIKSLEVLIADLKSTLDKEFKNGVEKINTEFQKFFSTMFGGGDAFLSVIVEHKKKRKDDEEEGETLLEDELEFERGIDINVTLPHKKVKDLHMLSGGERSLASIALLFAMSQVNPPPFLVLDETDAALDEANSKRYGDMLENLSAFSQLIVITHNRETMSRSGAMYGVTIGSDGGSKLLSVKFEEATQYAK